MISRSPTRFQPIPFADPLHDQLDQRHSNRLGPSGAPPASTERGILWSPSSSLSPSSLSPGALHEPAATYRPASNSISCGSLNKHSAQPFVPFSPFGAGSVPRHSHSGALPLSAPTLAAFTLRRAERHGPLSFEQASHKVSGALAPLSQPTAANTSANTSAHTLAGTRGLACPAPATPQGHATKPSANDATARTPNTPATAAQTESTARPLASSSRAPSCPARAPRAPSRREALARYDGPRSLCVRSSATGRLYRFDQTGATEVIDAADMALMRRIADITLL
jgi:hypothetical protein